MNMNNLSKLTGASSVLVALMIPLLALAATEKHSTLPSEPQTQLPSAQSVKPQVDAEISKQASERRKKLMDDAITALNESKKALKALEQKKAKEALAALEKVTGKLEFILARDPKLALAPVDVEIVTFDILSDLETIEKAIDQAKGYLKDGEIQKARPLVANLASEINFRTINILLGTYPAAIKSITPLIDNSKIDEAKARLETALNTLVVSMDHVVPLPKLRAEQLLNNAEKLAENNERTPQDNEKLTGYLQEARHQLKVAELLGYGTKKSFGPLYEQVSLIEEKTAGGKSGKGWFATIKQQVSELF